MAHGGLDLGAAEQLVHLATAVLVHQGDDGADLAGAPGASRAVQVGLVLLRRVGLDHERDVIDVDAAGSDIRRHQHVDPAAGQQLQVARAAALVQVTVQARRGDAGVFEVVAHLFGERTRAGEDEGLAVAGSELLDDLALVALLDEQHAVVDRG